MASAPESAANRGRRLSGGAFAAVVVVYLLIIQGGGQLLGHGDEGFRTVENLVETALIPIGASAVFAISVATWLGWWPQILHERKPVQQWTRIVPIALLIAALLGTSWGSLLDQKAGLILALVAMVLIVGFTEELMFRGIGLNVFRDLQFTEAKVALYSSLVFGAVHLSNALTTGGQALFQAAVVSFSGYLFYLTRRAYLAIWPAMLVHASQDFALISGQVGIDHKTEPQAVIVTLVMVGLAILLFRRRHRIDAEPAAAAAGGPAPGPGPD